MLNVFEPQLNVVSLMRQSDSNPNQLIEGIRFDQWRTDIERLQNHDDPLWNRESGTPHYVELFHESCRFDPLNLPSPEMFDRETKELCFCDRKTMTRRQLAFLVCRALQLSKQDFTGLSVYMIGATPSNPVTIQVWLKIEDKNC